MFASRLIAGLLALPLLAGMAAAQVKDLKISHQFKQGDSRDEAVRLFVKEVRARDSSLRFRIYPSGSLISAPIEQLAAMQDGSIEMAVYPINYGAGKVRAFSFSTIPGLIRSLDHG